MSPLDHPDALAAINETGARADGGRRLSDKILAAFSHAYAVGETDVAKKLRAALAASAAPRPGGRRGDQRRGHDPLAQADCWVAFVEARNRYKTAAGGDPAGAADALETMKAAYRAWSVS
jgi:hypothetical protein